MSFSEIADKMMKFLDDTEEAKNKAEAIQELRRAALMVALQGGKDEEIEKARVECLETYSAALDDFIRMHKELMRLKQEAQDAIRAKR